MVFDWPLLAALLHTGGAGALVMVMTWTLCASRAYSAISTRLASQDSRSRHTDRGDRGDRASMHTRTMNRLNP